MDSLILTRLSWTRRTICSLLAMLFLASSTLGLVACAPSQQNCSLNQTAIGAGVGVVGGAALGALLSHGNAGATLAGAALGGIAGGLVGHQGDEACKEYAMQKAFDAAQQTQLAMAEQQAAEARAEAQHARAEAARLRSKEAQRRAAEARKKEQQAEAAESQAKRDDSYKSVAWTNPSSGSHGTITPLNSYTNPATNQICMNYSATDSLDGKSSSGGGRVCKQADGSWKPVE